MKSLIALIIVILSVIGMIGTVIFAMNYRWVRNPEITQIQSTQLTDVVKIEMGGLPLGSKPVFIVSSSEIEKVVQALKRTTLQPSTSTEETHYIQFEYKDKRPPLRMWFAPGKADARFGKEVASLLDPYVKSIPIPKR